MSKNYDPLQDLEVWRTIWLANDHEIVGIVDSPPDTIIKYDPEIDGHPHQIGSQIVWTKPISKPSPFQRLKSK